MTSVRSSLLAIGAAAALAGGTAPLPAQDRGVRTVLVDSVRVRPVLRRIWDQSVRANREQVACIGGERRGAVFRVTRASDLTDVLVSSGSGGSFDSDSANVSREASSLSVDVCRPPEWSGTVHTHRIERGVEYPRMSAGDRAVVSLWHERWRRESVFCVMFSPEKPPSCEWRRGRD